MDQKPKVFISYSSADASWRERLCEHLGALHGHIDVWLDKRIAAGSPWKVDIDKELNECHLAILLLSRPFMASEFIRQHELPVLFKRHSKGEVKVVPLLVGACLWEEEAWLQPIEARPKPLRPLGHF